MLRWSINELNGWNWDAFREEMADALPLRWWAIRHISANPKDLQLSFAPFTKAKMKYVVLGFCSICNFCVQTCPYPFSWAGASNKSSVYVQLSVFLCGSLGRELTACNKKNQVSSKAQETRSGEHPPNGANPRRNVPQLTKGKKTSSGARYHRSRCFPKLFHIALARLFFFCESLEQTLSSKLFLQGPLNLFFAGL